MAPISEGPDLMYTSMPNIRRQDMDTEQEKTPKEYAVSLLEAEDFPKLMDVKALQRVLKAADEEWIVSFRESGGMAGISKAMAELAEGRAHYMAQGDDNNEHEVPEKEVLLEEELVRCIVVLHSKPRGLISLDASSDLIPILAESAIDSRSNYVRGSLLKLLTIVADSGPKGFYTVMNALDHVKVEKDEDQRFSLLVEAFGDADSSGVNLVTNLVVFFNTILSSAFEFEERVMLRTEMIQAGVVDAIQRIRDYFGLSSLGDGRSTDDGSDSCLSSTSSNSSMSTIVDEEMQSKIDELAAQLDLFDTVMNEDMKEADELIARDKSGVVLGHGEPEVKIIPDPVAVVSLRSAMNELEGKGEIRALVEVITANMERMVNAGCDVKQWKCIRDATSSALEANCENSDEDIDGDANNDPSKTPTEVLAMPPPPPPPPPMLPIPGVHRLPPGPKRRPVHWDKIAPAKETVFSEIDPSKVELPEGLLEGAFVEKRKKNANESGANVGAVGMTKKAARVELLDAKTLRNNGIVFKSIRTPPEELRDSVVKMELEKFDTDKLLILRGISPSQDDLPKLKGFEGDLKTLDEVSQFMVLTARIPRYQARLDCAIFMKGFSSDAEFLSERIRLVNEAVMEVVESERLKRLIAVVLAMGNYLNEGTRNGDAKAIKLESLLKLNTVKTMDKKKTLLHVLVEWAKGTEPDLLKLDHDVARASEASQWSLTDLNQQVAQLSKGFTLIEEQLKQAEEGINNPEGDRFAEVVKPFLADAKDRMQRLEAEYTRVQEGYDNAARRFGEDPSKVPSGDFFALVSSVVDMIVVAKRENELQAKSEERRRKREAQEKKRQEEKARKKLEQEEAKASKSSRNREEAKGGEMEAMLKRRRLIAVGSGEIDDSGSDFEDDEGVLTQDYERVKTQRVSEAAQFEQISKINDASKREIARRQLPYQKSTIGRQPSMLPLGLGNGSYSRRLGGGNPALARQVSAARQASHLRAFSAVRQASTVGRGLVRAPNILRPSSTGVRMSRRGDFSIESFDLRMARGPSGLLRREASEGPDMRRGVGSMDPRKQFRRLKSTAFIG